MKPGIVICTRLESKRLPQKPLIKFNGYPAIRLLVERLLQPPGPDIPICIALAGNPEDEKIYDALKDLPLHFFRGHPDNPLARLFWAAEEFGFDPIIRVTHDDILQDAELIRKMVEYHRTNAADYTYISDCVRGMDAEVISKHLLEFIYRECGPKAVEYISYVLRAASCNPKVQLFPTPPEYKSNIAMAFDLPEDLLALRVLFRYVHPLAPGAEITEALNTYPEISAINHKPAVSIYTCAYNVASTLGAAALSVLDLTFKDYEYIVYDDGSSDKTTTVMVTLSSIDKRVHLKRHASNRGLASSCNTVLPHLRGEVCLRLDADDELLPHAFDEPLELMQQNLLLTAVYPAYYQGGKIIQNTEHHIGGALMRTRILREVQFCDGLRHWEGKELFQRLSPKYQFLEYEKPTWIYHRSDQSLSGGADPRRERHGEIIGQKGGLI